MGKPSRSWRTWLRLWDEQQEAYDPRREERFGVILDAVRAAVGPRFVALDAGCGPGSLSARLLARFPRAKCVAVDRDPVTLRIGREALKRFADRLVWVDADLTLPGWVDRLPRRRYDAVVSTTALHWLDARALARFYRDVHTLLRPGGIFLDGDHFRAGPKDPLLSDMAGKIGTRRRRSRSRGAWEEWWRAVSREPALRNEMEEHRRREAGHPRHRDPPSWDDHVRSLRRAGFPYVTTLWQVLENRVLCAQRSSRARR
jgi:SAM-dependent methyltransferase